MSRKSSSATWLVLALAAIFIPLAEVALARNVDLSTVPKRDTVQLTMFHRWAEPLEDGIARIVADEIAARVPTEKVVMFPWRGVIARDLQYQVVIAVLRFDGRPGGDVTLDTRWRILGRDGKELVFKRSTVTEAATGLGYEAMVAAMTRALVALGGDIAGEIRALPR